MGHGLFKKASVSTAHKSLKVNVTESTAAVFKVSALIDNISADEFFNRPKL